MCEQKKQTEAESQDKLVIMTNKYNAAELNIVEAAKFADIQGLTYCCVFRCGVMSSSAHVQCLQLKA